MYADWVCLVPNCFNWHSHIKLCLNLGFLSFAIFPLKSCPLCLPGKYFPSFKSRCEVRLFLGCLPHSPQVELTPLSTLAPSLQSASVTISSLHISSYLSLYSELLEGSHVLISEYWVKYNDGELVLNRRAK